MHRLDGTDLKLHCCTTEQFKAMVEYTEFNLSVCKCLIWLFLEVDQYDFFRDDNDYYSSRRLISDNWNGYTFAEKVICRFRFFQCQQAFKLWRLISQIALWAGYWVRSQSGNSVKGGCIRAKVLHFQINLFNRQSDTKRRPIIGIMLKTRQANCNQLL